MYVIFVCLTLAQDLPPVKLTDITWAYTEDAISKQYNAAYDHLVWCNNHLERCLLEDRKFWLAAVEDANWRKVVWFEMRFVSDKIWLDSFRLIELSKLRDLIGRAAYYNGAIPPPVPYWRVRIQEPSEVPRLNK